MSEKIVSRAPNLKKIKERKICHQFKKKKKRM